MRFAVLILMIISLFAVKISADTLRTAVQDTAQYLKNPNYQPRMAFFEANKSRKGEIVMLGNSITHGGNWVQLLGRDDVIEMGISSDITEGMLNRLQYVYLAEPKMVFIMAGVNDIYAGIPVETVMVNYIQILKNLKLRGIKPVIQSTLYAGEKWKNSAERNKDVELLNYLLKKYAKENDIIYMDLIPEMSQGLFLREELSRDNLHLNSKGYEVWIKEIKKVLEEEGL